MKEAKKKFMDKLSKPENQQLLLKYKQNQHSYQEAYRQKQLQDEEKAANYRRRKAEIQRKYQAKKDKINREQNHSGGPGFQSLTALGRAVKKIESVLPKDKQKAQEALRSASKNYAEENMIVSAPVPLKKKQKQCFVETTEIVKSFFELESVSRQLPGVKDFITLKDELGNKTKIQKRVMLMTVAEAYEAFKKLNPERKISSSKFHSLRPAHVIIASKAPHNVCCCIYCKNMDFIVDSLSPHLQQIQTTSDLTMKLVCCTDNYECMASKCKSCLNFESNLDKILLPHDDQTTVKLSQWEKVDNFVQIVQRTEKLDDVKKLLLTKFGQFKLHKFVAKTQFVAMSEIKKNQNSNECLVIMDYSQNFSSVTQDEVQSAFFSRRQISVFTAIAYVGQSPPKPFIIVNDDIQHQKEQVIYKLLVWLRFVRVVWPNWFV